MAKTKKTQTKPASATENKRVLIHIRGGFVVHVDSDPNIDHEIIDWDNLKQGATLTREDFRTLTQEWGAGLLSQSDIDQLELYIERDIDCLACKRTAAKSAYFNAGPSRRFNEKPVCPRCGYDGGKLSAGDPHEHHDEWEELFEET